MFNNKVLFITGGTGSFGSQFAKYILQNYKPKKIIIYSRDELKQFQMKNDFFFKKFLKILRFFIGDVRDLYRLDFAMEKVDFVLHAAALKQVDTGEYNPFEFIKTNIIGAQNIIDASLKNGIKKVVALSTDKASSPINLYGATKLCSDKLFTSANNYTGNRKITFSVARYGNVMGSRGSVIKKFIESKKKNYVIPITDLDMTRFSITLNQSVIFVEKCFNEMKGGEIFIPKIKSYKILDLKNSIAPKCKINVIGKRQGEKIHESLLSQFEAVNTVEYSKHFCILDPIIIKNKKIVKYKNDLKSKKCKKVKNDFSYVSNRNSFLKVSEIKNLIKNNI